MFNDSLEWFNLRHHFTCSSLVRLSELDRNPFFTGLRRVFRDNLLLWFHPGPIRIRYSRKEKTNRRLNKLETVSPIVSQLVSCKSYFSHFRHHLVQSYNCNLYALTKVSIQGESKLSVNHKNQKYVFLEGENISGYYERDAFSIWTQILCFTFWIELYAASFEINKIKILKLITGRSITEFFVDNKSFVKKICKIH